VVTTNQQIVEAYRDLQQRMTDLLGQMDPDQADLVVPATPEWRVRELVAHVVGVAADVAAGRLEGAGSDPWTAVQVEQRQGRSMEELLAEWRSGTPDFEAAVLASEPARVAQALFDASTHEHDLRGALQQPGARDSDALEIGWGWATGVLGQLRDGYGSGAIRLSTEHGDEVFGSGETTAAVRAQRFELFRALSGRRSHDQVRAWAWEGEPAIEAVCLLPARSTPLEE
jgi:uncharacterized protein (TIGR03083 family)